MKAACEMLTSLYIRTVVTVMVLTKLHWETLDASIRRDPRFQSAYHPETRVLKVLIWSESTSAPKPSFFRCSDGRGILRSAASSVRLVRADIMNSGRVDSDGRREQALIQDNLA